VTDLAEAFVLTGPTASGKSAVGLLLAERLDAEIICMDSMTVYRGMEIGTAKPSEADRRRVRHHLLDERDPWEGASVAWWLARAAEVASAIRRRGKAVLIVGGTPLYLKALLHGLFAGPPVDAELRRELEATPNAQLHERLQQVDPAAAARLHVNDQKRLVRALEVHQQTGRPISELQQQFANALPRRHAPLWLNWPRDVLYRRIEARVDGMLAAGWLEEVRHLLALPQPLGKEAAQAAGYRELADHLAGRLTLEEAIQLTKTRTRQLAKRQLTWFRNLPGLGSVPVDEHDSIETIAVRCLAEWSGTEEATARMLRQSPPP
jgi:tRNA dimethylallyltransferase